MNFIIYSIRKIGLGLSLGMALAGANDVLGSDHREAPAIYTDATADITDFYAFLNPNDASKLVLVMNVNAFASTTSPGSYQFSNRVRYNFRIDNDGDAKADHTITARFGEPHDMAQPMRVYFPGWLKVNADVTLVPTSALEPPEPIITEGPGGIRIFAGLRDDPFFFDVVASFRTFSGLGTFSTAIDRFAGYNISALVVELPLDMVSSYPGQTISVWSDTERLVKKGWRWKWRQVQRVGNPAVKPIFIEDGLKDKFNRTLPHMDEELYTESITNAVLYGLGGDQEVLDLVLSQIVPDVIRIDPTQPIEWPNGRALDEDTMDLMFSYNLNKPFVYAPGELDGVNENDVEFLDEFPYLAPPHIAP